MMKKLMKRSKALLLFVILLPFSASAVEKGFVDIKEVIPDVILNIRYHSSYNFVGERVDGYSKPKCYLSKEAAKALEKVQEELKKHGMSLLIYDCYRPQRAVNHFVKWAKNIDDKKMKSVFYPAEDKRYLFKRGYIASRSGHSRGSTIDLSIAKLPHTGFEGTVENKEECNCKQEKRFSDGSIDMGTGFDCFSPKSATMNKKITKEQKQNRMLLKKVMEKYGFKNYSREWWHFTLKNEPYKKKYFNFPVE